MNKNKLLYTLTTILVLVILFNHLPASAGCSSRQLKKVCNVCKQGALNSSQCNNSSSSSCPICTTTQSCPTCSSSSDLFDQARNLLRSSYTLSISLQGNGTHNYSLSISGIDNIGAVTYSATDLNANFNLLGAGTLAISALGGGLLNIDVPFIAPDGTLYDLACGIAIKSNSTLLGACSGIRALNSNVGTVLNGTLTSL